MRLRVDPLKCQGHARCFALVPELFDVDDYGMSSVKGDGTVAPALEERARLAVANCPEFAIEEITDGSEPASGAESLARHSGGASRPS
ncbi:MAG TPA: ferredoxin [Acidimicrobiales bacterium]